MRTKYPWCSFGLHAMPIHVNQFAYLTKIALFFYYTKLFTISVNIRSKKIVLVGCFQRYDEIIQEN